MQIGHLETAWFIKGIASNATDFYDVMDSNPLPLATQSFKCIPLNGLPTKFEWEKSIWQLIITTCNAATIDNYIIDLIWWYLSCYDVQSDIDIFLIVESDSEIITV